MGDEDPLDAAAAINLRYLYGLLQRYRWLIIGVTIASALAGVALTMLITPRYTASSSVQIDQEAKRA
ncbi:MAG: hypothetical protein IPL18_12020 [Sphingomonadales bacterium]|nr:hypothetical protein [Sphingomonadales bacterium]